MIRTIKIFNFLSKKNILEKISAKLSVKLRKIINPYYYFKFIYFKKRKSYYKKTEYREYNDVALLLNDAKDEANKNNSYIQNQKLLQIAKYAFKHCSYYKHTFQQVGFDLNDLSKFNQLPLLDKTIIRNHYDELISDEIYLMDVYKMNTGGSTGEPLGFLVSNLVGRIDAIHQEFVFKTTMGYRPGDVIVAFDGTSVPSCYVNNNIYWVDTGGKDIPYGRLSYSSLYLNNETMPYYIEHIIKTAPSILRGYPSFINDISEYILAKNISIPFFVKGIQLTAENVYDWQIENIQQAFNAKVFLQYGHSEVCVFGYTLNDTYEYICSPYYGYTEVLDEDGQHVNIGDIGEIVVTGFYNYAMPFIRYKTGDLGLFNGNTNGIVRLGKIIGRAQDYVYTKDGLKIALTALIFGQHYQAFKNIRKWQLQQDIPGKLVIRIIRNEKFTLDDEMEIRRKFKDICDVDIKFEYVDFIPLTLRGKFRFLIQNIQI